ncbi:hypothetical protein [Halomonas salinarum]|nr:hypothetical protein [Halomonas salinarum]
MVKRPGRAHTCSKVGDGKTFVSPLEQVSGTPHRRIRTGETDKGAV